MSLVVFRDTLLPKNMTVVSFVLDFFDESTCCFRYHIVRVVFKLNKDIPTYWGRTIIHIRTCQSVNQWVSESVSQSVSQPVSRSVSQSASQPVSQTVSHCGERANNWLIDWSINWLILSPSDWWYNTCILQVNWHRMCLPVYFWLRWRSETCHYWRHLWPEHSLVRVGNCDHVLPQRQVFHSCSGDEYLWVNLRV